MRSFSRNQLRLRQREVFRAAEIAPVEITFMGKRNLVLMHARLFGTFDDLPSFTAEDVYRNASLVFPEADKGPVSITVRGRDLFVLVSADYYQLCFLDGGTGDDTPGEQGLPPRVTYNLRQMRDLGTTVLAARGRMEQLGLGGLGHSEQLVLLAIADLLYRRREKKVRKGEIDRHPLTATTTPLTVSRALRALVGKGLLQYAPGYRKAVYCVGPRMADLVSGNPSVDENSH